MRRSEAMARRTLSTSAPNSSQTFATSFMNEIRVASIALAAYLHSSALAQSITMIGAPVRVNGRVQLLHQISAPRGSSAPITTRSGFRKSSTAAPCFRNSGLLTTLNGCVVSRRIDFADALGGADRHGALVDDDLVAVHRPRHVARDGEHMLQIGRSVLGLRRAHGDEDDLRPPHRSRKRGREASSGLRPRSAGPSPRARARRWESCPSGARGSSAASLSTQTTSLPFSAKQAPTTSPTYPVPTTAICMRSDPSGLEPASPTTNLTP